MPHSSIAAGAVQAYAAVGDVGGMVEADAVDPRCRCSG